MGDGRLTMNPDVYTIGISSLSFLFFLILQFMIFRRINQLAVLNWLVRIYIAGLLVDIILVLNFFGLLYIDVLLISSLNYSMLALVYVLGVFGMMESALRIRMLLEIYNAKREGISSSKLLKIYNKDMIISKRLERLTKSGDLKKEGEYYYIGRKTSYLSLNCYLLKILRKYYL